MNRKIGGLKKPRDKRVKPDLTDDVSLNELLKWEIAEELGLLDRIRTEGWESLTGVECGRIGGLVRHRLKKLTETV